MSLRIGGYEGVESRLYMDEALGVKLYGEEADYALKMPGFKEVIPYFEEYGTTCKVIYKIFDSHNDSKLDIAFDIITRIAEERLNMDKDHAFDYVCRNNPCCY